jgi:catalase
MSNNHDTTKQQVMSPTDRDHLVSNIVGALSNGVERLIQEGKP